MEHPVHFVSTCGATTVDGLGFCAALRLRDDDTEVRTAHGARPGEVDGHTSRLPLQIGPYNGMRPARFKNHAYYGAAPRQIGT